MYYTKIVPFQTIQFSIMSWEPYPSDHNGLFSPLLGLRDFAARGADQYRSAPLQVPGSTSAGRVICGTDQAECVSVPGFLWPQGTFHPGFYPLRGEVLPGAWGAPNKGNADEAVGFFWKCRTRVGSGPAHRPTKKGLVPHMPIWWGGHQIPQIIIGLIRTVRDFLLFLCNSIFLV